MDRSEEIKPVKAERGKPGARETPLRVVFKSSKNSPVREELNAVPELRARIKEGEVRGERRGLSQSSAMSKNRRRAECLVQWLWY